jgi:signal transduction histidine kinase
MSTEQPINILIVDDEPKNLTVLEAVLNDPGYRLVRAETAEKALLALVVDEFALLILDIRMPGMTGFELAQMIKGRKKTATVPIIFLTAYYNEDQHILEGYGTGAVDYLHKPVNPAILRSKVAVFAELHRKNRECGLSNRALVAEVTERLQAEKHLHEINQSLEQLVIERTAALESLRRSEQHQAELLEQSRAMEERLRHLSRQVLQAQEDERKRVSRELHDVVAQTLASINLRLEALLPDANGRADGLRDTIAQMRRLVSESVETVHRFARDLRPSTLDDLGLIPTLNAYLKEFTQQTGIRTTLTACASVEDLESAGRTVLYRVAQEALTNVARHAKARRIRVTIDQIEDLIRMEIKDDGQGIAVNGAAAAQKNERLGMLGMRERVEIIGGSFAVESVPGTSTTVRVELSAGLPKTECEHLR